MIAGDYTKGYGGDVLGSDTGRLRLAAFEDSDLERDYVRSSMREALPYVRPLVLVLGVLYLAFLIPDSRLIANPGTFRFIAASRALVFFAILFLYHEMGRIGDEARFKRWFTAYQLLIGGSFLSIFAVYEDPDLLIQTNGAVILIVVVYLIPNQWVNKVVVSVAVATGFLGVGFLRPGHFDSNEYVAAVVYLAAILVLNAVSSYRLAISKRTAYLRGRRLARISVTDPLTGVYNRNKFDEDMDSWIAQAERYRIPLSLALFDVDDFKATNDVRGHLAGDRILADLARSVSGAVRETDIFARWGGDEFVLLMPNTDARESRDVVARLRARIEVESELRCSFGVATLHLGEDKGGLLYRVDRNLYAAKSRGGNAVVGEGELATGEIDIFGTAVEIGNWPVGGEFPRGGEGRTGQAVRLPDDESANARRKKGAHQR